MNTGRAPRVPFHASRTWRAVVLLVASAAILSACGASGSDATPGGDRSATVGSGSAGTEVVGSAVADAPVGGQVVECFDLEPAAWTAAPTETDLPAKISDGEAPGLAGTAPAGPAQSTATFATADDFLAQSNVPDPAARKTVMEQSGFTGGSEAEWTDGNGFTMQALSFADAPGAATYVEARLPSICGQGGTQEGVTILGDGDGITWIDPLGATHGEFIFGGSQVSLTSCGGCEPVSLDEMQAWHDAFVEAYATGPAAPIS